MGLPLAALAIAGVGTAVQVAGQIEAGQAQANAANYNAQVARNNANYASAAGQQQATTESMKNADMEGRIKTGQAANNIDVDSGSAVKVQQGAREAGNIDTQTVENNALLTAYGYQQEGSLQAGEAKQAIIGADIGAVGTILGNASSTGFKWASLGQGGAGAAAAAG